MSFLIKQLNKFFTTLKKCFLPNLNPTGYLKVLKNLFWCFASTCRRNNYCYWGHGYEPIQ